MPRKPPALTLPDSGPSAIHGRLSAISPPSGARGWGRWLAPPPPCEISAPPGIVRAAVGNLLRNAIENSDSGCIDIRLQPDATVVIHDPGHGMSPEQISAVYTRMARAGESMGEPTD